MPNKKFLRRNTNEYLLNFFDLIGLSIYIPIGTYISLFTLTPILFRWVIRLFDTHQLVSLWIAQYLSKL